MADVALVLGTLSILRWRLRADERGIARRRFARWHLYAWEEFASGGVKEGVYRESYVFGDRPPWNRKLSLEPLRDEDRAVLRAMIQRVWVRPPEPEDPLDLGFRFFFRNVARLARECLTITHRGEERRYAWGEVRVLKIRRLERARRDFSSLELHLPDRMIKLRVAIDHGRAIPSWSALPGRPRPDPATVATALLKDVPPERVIITSLSEPPASWAEWEDRRSILQERSKEIRTLWRVMAVFGALSLAHCLYRASEGWASGVVMLVLYLVMFGVVWLVVRYLTAEHVRVVQDLESQVPDRTAAATNERQGGDSR